STPSHSPKTSSKKPNNTNTKCTAQCEDHSGQSSSPGNKSKTKNGWHSSNTSPKTGSTPSATSPTPPDHDDHSTNPAPHAATNTHQAKTANAYQHSQPGYGTQQEKPSHHQKTGKSRAVIAAPNGHDAKLPKVIGEHSGNVLK